METDEQSQPQSAVAQIESSSASLPSSHPLLRGAQEALKLQLKTRLAAVDQRLLESRVKAREVNAEHTDLGQHLFEAQNRLRAFQYKIKKLTEEEEAARKERTASENEMQKAAEQLRAEQRAVAATQERLLKTRGDYNELKFALQRAQEHTTKLEDAIKLKRRQLYKDTESLRKDELQKMRQDFFLDRLHGQLQELTEEKELLLAQLKAQDADLELSKNAIQDSKREIESVVHGKRQLRAQLDSCMQGLLLRSRAECTIKEAIQAQEAKVATVQNDVRELERTMQDLREANETLTLKLNATRCQLKGVREQIDKEEDTQLRMREQVGVLRRSLDQAENDAKKAESLAAKLSSQRDAVIREIQDSTQACNSLTDQIFEALANRAFVTRAGAKTKSLLKECETREAELFKVDFERAQLQVESVGVRAATASTEEDIAGLDIEIKEKEKLIDQECHTSGYQELAAASFEMILAI
ncbi:hypothetical protein Esti_006049 [Eimeria stiedai]